MTNAHITPSISSYIPLMFTDFLLSIVGLIMTLQIVIAKIFCIRVFSDHLAALIAI
jgi:hypothetical protein